MLAAVASFVFRSSNVIVFSFTLLFVACFLSSGRKIWLSAKPNMGGCEVKYGCLRNRIWEVAKPNMVVCETEYGRLRSRIWEYAKPNMGGCEAEYGSMRNRIWEVAKPYMVVCETVYGCPRNRLWSSNKCLFELSNGFCSVFKRFCLLSSVRLTAFSRFCRLSSGRLTVVLLSGRFGFCCRTPFVTRAPAIAANVWKIYEVKKRGFSQTLQS
jgi:hypothetical protein